MKHWQFRQIALPVLALSGFLIFMPTLICGADAIADGNAQPRAMSNEFAALWEQSAKSVFTDLGGGFYSVYMPLSPKLRQHFEESLAMEELSAKAQTQSLTVISVGQATATPTTPITTAHGALSDTTYPYTYWVITLNLGTQTVTKSTTFKLTGPGLKFNRSVPMVYGAGGIWGIGYRPGVGVGTPGIYTFQGSVSGGGSMTTKSFAINP